MTSSQQPQPQPQPLLATPSPSDDDYNEPSQERITVKDVGLTHTINLNRWGEDFDHLVSIWQHMFITGLITKK
jgi:hypothetical protein